MRLERALSRFGDGFATRNVRKRISELGREFQFAFSPSGRSIPSDGHRCLARGLFLSSDSVACIRGSVGLAVAHRGNSATLSIPLHSGLLQVVPLGLACVVRWEGGDKGSCAGRREYLKRLLEIGDLRDKASVQAQTKAAISLTVWRKECLMTSKQGPR
jgi:hypothetical protein